MIGVNTRRTNRNDGGSSDPRMAIEASVPQEEAESNQNGEGSERFVCDKCNRAFTTKIGRGQHIRQAHKEEYNSAINVERVKSRWSEEEVRMMAVVEVDAIRKGLININQVLCKRFPKRTLEAIKGKRKQLAYKGIVEELLRKVESITQEENPEPMDESSHRTESVRLRVAVEEGIASLADNKLPSTRELCKLAKRLVDGESLNNNELSGWLKTVFKHAKPPRGPVVQEHEVNNKNSFKRRRQEYAIMQKLFQSDFRSAVRRVLSDKEEIIEMPPAKEVTDFWKGVFENEPVENARYAQPDHRVNEELDGLWIPIRLEEVRANELCENSASGPDGITVLNWKKIDCRVRALLLNMILMNGKLDNELKMARTVLIPKGTGKLGPGDTRPLSITSVVVRHLHKILAQRFKVLHRFNDSQRAFIDCDGTQENLTILNTILADARMSKKSVHIATLDLRKAFDSVTHETIVETITALGCPKQFIDYIADLYTDAKTLLQYDSQSTVLNIKRGVLQGDPISALLFIAVMDRAIEKLSEEIGYKINGLTIRCIAYADDIILIASTQQGLQTLIDALTSELASFGLMTNHEKSSTLSLVPSGREKKMKVITQSQFKIDNQYLKAIGVMDVWKYLGVQFRCANIDDKKLGLCEDLKRVDKAALKPQQRLRMLRSAIIPKYLHVLILGKTTIGKLQTYDRTLRSHVRKWLYLPKDVPLAYFYADIKSGGLGITNLEHQVPLIKKNRMSKFVNKEDTIPSNFKQSIYISRQLEWCDRALSSIGESVTRAMRSAHWEDRLYDMIDTNDLSEAKHCSVSNAWIDRKSDKISGQDYIHYNHIRVGCLPSRARTTRGDNLADRLCRGGCGVSETNYHIIQQCHRTHGGRVLRHDRLVNLIEENLNKRNGQKYKNIKEPKLKTSVGLRKPDLLITSNGSTTVLDIQVVSGRYMARDHRNKIEKYKSIPGMDDVIKKKCASSTVVYDAITLSYKGLIERNSYKTLKHLGFNEQFCLILMTSVLRGTWLNWQRFNKNTALVH